MIAAKIQNQDSIVKYRGDSEQSLILFCSMHCVACLNYVTFAAGSLTRRDLYSGNPETGLKGGKHSIVSVCLPYNRRTTLFILRVVAVFFLLKAFL